MASTISPRVVLTDDSGTFEAPNNDGTVINNALFQTVQDRIDALFSTDLAVADLIVESFGAHPIFVASGAGTNSLEVRNLAAGTANTAAYLLGNDVASGRGSIAVTASNHASLPPDSLVVASSGANGIVVRSTGTTSGIQVQTLLPLEIYINNSFTVAVHGASGRGLVVQGAPDGSPYAGADVTGVYVAPDCTGASSIAVGLEVAPALAGQYVYGTILRAPLVVGAHTHASTLTIVGPPTGGGGGVFYALEIGAGRVWNQGQYTSGNGTAAAPMYSFLAAPATGLFYQPGAGATGELQVSAAGAVCLQIGRFSGTETYIQIGASIADLGAAHTDFISITADAILLGTAAETTTQAITVHPQAVQFPNMVTLTGANYVHLYTGGAYVNALVKTSSSARYKTAITDLDDDPLRVLRLRPRLYHDAHVMPGRAERAFAGLIAEEVAEVLPTLVVANAEGTPENVMYDRVPVYLLRAVQALVARVEALEGRAYDAAPPRP